MAEKKNEGAQERGQMTVKEAGERVRDLVEKGKEVESEQGREASKAREEEPPTTKGGRR